jgi:hypothetical protein
MSATLVLRDESPSGTLLRTRTLDCVEEEITVRDLITRRVREEVRDYNRIAARGASFTGLVRPEAVDAPGEIDWEAQRDVALHAFTTNGFFVLVGDRQVESLDERIRIGLGTEVSFVKLVPLVGG